MVPEFCTLPRVSSGHLNKKLPKITPTMQLFKQKTNVDKMFLINVMYIFIVYLLLCAMYF